MVAARELPPLERLEELFRYDPQSGLVTRNIDKRSSQGNLVGREGSIVGTADNRGYLVCRVDFRTCKVHRIAWALFYRAEPPAIIDHVDGDTANNCICNLRAASAKESARHRRLKSDGAWLRRKEGKWEAAIQANGEYRRLGYFRSRLEAAAAYREAAIEIYGAFMPRFAGVA